MLYLVCRFGCTCAFGKYQLIASETILSATSVMPYFTWILALLAILGYKIVEPLIAVLALAKGSLIFVTV